jgi:hypothetical protein
VASDRILREVVYGEVAAKSWSVAALSCSVGAAWSWFVAAWSCGAAESGAA